MAADFNNFVDISDGPRDIDLSGVGEIQHFDCRKRNESCEFIDHLKGFLDEGFVRFHFLL